MGARQKFFLFWFLYSDFFFLDMDRVALNSHCHGWRRGFVLMLLLYVVQNLGQREHCVRDVLEAQVAVKIKGRRMSLCLMRRLTS